MPNNADSIRHYSALIGASLTQTLWKPYAPSCFDATSASPIRRAFFKETPFSTTSSKPSTTAFRSIRENALNFCVLTRNFKVSIGRRDANLRVKGVFFNNVSNSTPLTCHFAATTPSTSSRATIPSSNATAPCSKPLTDTDAPRAASCDFASQSSSLRSSGNLTASPQAHLRSAYAFRLHLPRNFYLPSLRQRVTTTRLTCMLQIRRV